MLIADPIIDHARCIPDKIAIITENQSYTYQDFHKQVQHVTRYLQNWKKSYPEREEYKLAILLKNRVEFLSFFLGAAQAGWVAIPLDPKWSGSELGHALRDSEPHVLAIDVSYEGRLAQIPLTLTVIPVTDGFAPELSEGLPMVAEPDSGQSERDPFYMGFTSGTTGRPKGFFRSHRSWVKSFECSEVEFGFGSADMILVPGPLVHSTFLYAAVHALYIGATVYLLEKFSPGKVMDAIENFPVTAIYMVPTMFEAISAYKEEKAVCIEGNAIRAIVSAGAKWSPLSKQRVAQWFPQANLYEFYGASELSFVTILDSHGNREKPDSVGRPFHQVEVSIRDSLGREVGAGEVGKLYVRSELLFLGYYRNEAETRNVLQEDGWATVHDLARRDEEGYIYLVGREKNMIIHGGLNIYPEEVEMVLKGHPAVDEAVVVGIPDTYWGEKVLAVIRLKSANLPLGNREIQAHCRKHLAGYKCPREIRVVEDFPYTTSGKVARMELNKLVMNEGIVK